MTTFCVMLNKELIVSTCPLIKGRCYWQHVETNSCKYTVLDLSVEDFCARTGREPPNEKQRLEIFNRLKSVLHP